MFFRESLTSCLLYSPNFTQPPQNRNRRAYKVTLLFFLLVPWTVNVLISAYYHRESVQTNILGNPLEFYIIVVEISHTSFHTLSAWCIMREYGHLSFIRVGGLAMLSVNFYYVVHRWYIRHHDTLLMVIVYTKTFLYCSEVPERNGGGGGGVNKAVKKPNGKEF